MKEILAALTLAMTELRTKANSALQGVGPVDQYEGAQEVAYALRSLQWSADTVKDMLEQVDSVMAKIDPEVSAAAASLVDGLLTERVAAGEYMAKGDVELAIESAVRRGEGLAQAAFAKREEEAATLASRRGEIAAAHGPEVADMVPAEVLTGEGYVAAQAELGRRVEALTAIGVTAASKKTAFADMACGLPFDEAGAGVFDARLATIKDVVGEVKPDAQGAASRSGHTPGSGAPVAATTTTPDAGTPSGFAF